ncbi:MAG: CoA-binding protein [Proteobacteria bacterium]|nr:CoA-binding protein [Pseudomonadota bacterium]
MRSVREVMDSKNMVVFGASQDPFKPGAMLLDTLRQTGFKGQVAGINPRGGEMHGYPLYKSLDDVPFDVGVASMLIPPKAVPAALLDCARKGVRGVVISSEGFAESGEEGRAIQDEVRRILRENDIRGFGPNTLGLVNTETGLLTSYFANQNMVSPGAFGFASQSGIFVGALLQYMSSFPVYRLSKGLGLGNKVDVDESDALEYFLQDEQTRVIGLYLEDVRDGRRFLEQARRAARKKPVLLLKGGRTEAGSLATASHTASLAVNDAVFDGALRQAGVLRVKNVDQLLGDVMAFQWAPLPKGDRIALVTFSGAQAIMSIDQAMEEGLSVASFQPETLDRLSEVISTFPKRKNPVDIYPDMNVHGFEKTYTEIINALLDDDGVHGIFLISFAMFDPNMLRPLVEIIKARANKPVFFSLLGTAEGMAAAWDFLMSEQIPIYRFPEFAVQAFAHMWRFARSINQAG